MPTAEQIQRHTLPRSTFVAAGEEGIYNEVNRVSTLRSVSAVDRLKPNDLVIIDDDAVIQAGKELSSLISSIINQEISGIAIRGKLHGDVLKIANKSRVPVFSLPPDTDITTLESKIAGMIREERERLYKIEQTIAPEIMDLAVKGRGVKGILEKIKQISGGTVILLGPDFEPSSGPMSSRISNIHKNLSKIFSNPPAAMTGVKPAGSTPGFISPISGQKEYLLVLSSSTRLKDIDRVAAKLGAQALAIELSHRQAVEDTEEKFQSEMIEALLSGQLSVQAIGERAVRLGLDMSQKYMVIEVDPANKSNILSNVKRIKSVFGENALCYLRNDILIAIYKLIPEISTLEDLRKLNKSIARKLEDHLGGKVSMGMGRAYAGPGGLRTSFLEAEQALTTGRRLFGVGTASFFGDLGIYRLLLSLDIGELKQFYQESIGPLDEYDRLHNSELVHTLESLLHSPTIAETAKNLHVHRNTLLYRMQRIQEILNTNLEDGETRLRLHLALKAHDIIKAA